MVEALLFFAPASLIIIGALIVIFAKNPVHNAMGLVMTLVSLAIIYITLNATFVAMVQMLVYAGAVMMDEDTNLVSAAKSIVSFFAHESCGQCTPCREGTTWLEMILDRIASGRGRTSDMNLLLDVCDNISPGLSWPPKMTTICPLGPSAVSPITSLMNDFRDEVESLIPTKVLL